MPINFYIPCKVMGPVPSLLEGIALGASAGVRSFFPKNAYLEFVDGIMTIRTRNTLGVNVSVIKAKFADLGRLVIEKDTSKGYNVASKLDNGIPLSFLGSIVITIFSLFFLSGYFDIKGESLAGFLLIIWPCGFVLILGAILLLTWIRPNPFLIVILYFNNGGPFSIRIRDTQLQNVQTACDQLGFTVEGGSVVDRSSFQDRQIQGNSP